MKQLTSTFLAAFTVSLALSAQDGFSPARYQSGAVPALPVTAIGGGEVLLQLAVTRDGRVRSVTPLRATPPFTDAVTEAARQWLFVPAGVALLRRADERPAQQPVDSTVLVAATFRPPTSYSSPALSDPPKDVGPASDEVALPLTMAAPPFPPLAYSGGVVLVEVRVEADGRVSDVAVIRSAPPFDEPAAAAARQWTFRPARVRGTATPTFAYIVFGFPVPLGPLARPR